MMSSMCQQQLAAGGNTELSAGKYSERTITTAATIVNKEYQQGKEDRNVTEQAWVGCFREKIWDRA